MKRKFLLLALAAATLAIGIDGAMADSDRMRISRRDCLNLVEYRPDPDVAYRPGLDVRGKPVVPADLPGSSMAVRLPDQVEFDISFNPLKGKSRRRFGQTELYVGTVRYDLTTGEATFNGNPLTNPEKDEIARRCREVLRRR
jgi:hypothetical protein